MKDSIVVTISVLRAAENLTYVNFGFWNHDFRFFWRLQTTVFVVYRLVTACLVVIAAMCMVYRCVWSFSVNLFRFLEPLRFHGIPWVQGSVNRWIPSLSDITSCGIPGEVDDTNNCEGNLRRLRTTCFMANQDRCSFRITLMSLFDVCTIVTHILQW
jgi:hypothetical protein